MGEIKGEFGTFIAFTLPGILFWAVIITSYLVAGPEITLMQAKEFLSLGSAIFLLSFSLAIGLIFNAISGLLFLKFNVLRVNGTGLKPETFASENGFRAFAVLQKEMFRYYQFYANGSCAITFGLIVVVFGLKCPIPLTLWLPLGGSAVLLIFCARLTLKDYFVQLVELQKPEEKE